VLKIIAWIIGIIIALAIMVPIAIYIPGVQDFVKEIALQKVKESTGMEIQADYLRLKFPLRVTLEGIGVVEATGDTMLRAGALNVDVKMLPLLKGDIVVTSAEASDLYYRMGTPDSIMYLRANVRHARFNAASVRLGAGDIDIDLAEVEGARVNLIMLDSVAPEKTDTTASSPWRIAATQIRLTDTEYRMQMLPTIDSLYTYVGSAQLDDGLVDMASYRIKARCLSVDSVTAAYFIPTPEYLASHPARPDSLSTTTPTDSTEAWTITADSLRLTGNRAVYAVRNAVPVPGLDMNYIEVSGIEIAVDSFYNRATDITVPVRNLRATERCGLTLMADGTFAMKSGIMNARDFNISTYASRFAFNAVMGLGDLTKDPDLPLQLKADATVALSDIELAMPSLHQTLKPLPRSKPLTLKADIEGTSGRLFVNGLRADLGNILHFSAEGEVENPMDFNKMNGEVKLDGSVASLNFMKPSLLEASMARQVNLPPMRLKGAVDYSPGLISGNVGLVATGGRIALRGAWNQTAKGYNGALSVNHMNVADFMPSLGVGIITADLKVKGKGYNPLEKNAAIDALIRVEEAEYLGQTYKDLTLDALLQDGQAKGSLKSTNENARLDLGFTASIDTDTIRWDMDGDIDNLDLRAMKITTDTMGGSMRLKSRGWMSPKNGYIDASAHIYDLDWLMGKTRLETAAINATLVTDSTFHATLLNGDLNLAIDAYCPMDSLMKRFTALGDSLKLYIDRRNVDIRGLQSAMPPMDMALQAGDSNVASEYLKASDMGFKNVTMGFHNDSLMALNAKVIQFRTGTTYLDTINVEALQHGKFLIYKGHMGNRPGTMDGFAKVNLTGYLADDKFAFIMNQSNIEGKTGFSIGMSAAIADSTVTVRLVPRKPTIGYKPWTLNPDNFVSFNFITNHLDANLTLENEKSSLHLFTNHKPGEDEHQEAVTLDISKIQIADWLSISPFAPPIKGELSADMNFNWAEDLKQLTGKGVIDLDDLFYGKDRVGSFGLGVDITTTSGGTLRADASLMVDSVEVITARGSLNDTTARDPFLLDFSMIKFPLKTVNPFLPKEMAQLSGTLNGQMDITGSMTEPVFNGYLDFDSTAVKVGMLGTSFKFSEEKIPVDSNIVNFNDFTILGCNENPLHISGVVDVRKITNVALDLSMKAADMQLVNSKKAKGADVYGKAFVDLDASVKGDMSFMDVKANINVLPSTNVTYIAAMSSTDALGSQSTEDMVKFVNFNDTTQVLDADSIATSQLALLLDANLSVSQGSTINVDLPGNANNKVSIKGNGDLTFTMSPMSEGRLTGRFNIDQGYARYTPPIMLVSEKYFTFNEGSYVAFNGDMMNPILNIHATDEMKANVTESNNSRLVTFYVTLAVTNTLDNMHVVFDLSAPDDISVQNEISSMSPEQRANQAMNLLLYGEYTGPNTKATTDMSVNMLYSFVEGTVNNWLANNVKGVDISLGVNQYNQTTNGVTSSTMTYSYKVSKSLMNDRIKIIVGGNYNMDADNDENLQQNLINDISFEYLLNQSGTMVIRIFRHTGFESILEGEVTQTGVGFVYKRKLGSLRDIFRRSRKKPVAIQVEAPLQTDDATKPDEPAAKENGSESSD